MFAPFTIAGLSTLVGALCVCAGSVVAGEQDDNSILGIVPQPEIQRKFDRLFRVLSPENKNHTQQQTASTWVELVGMLDDGKPETLRQLLYWSHDASGVLAGMLPIVIADRSSLDDQTIAQAIAPIINDMYEAELPYDEREDELRRSGETDNIYELTMMLAEMVEHPVRSFGYQLRDFSSYREFLPDSGDDDPTEETGLIAYMFRGAPGQALLMIAEVRLGRDAMLEEFFEREHAISDHLFWRRWSHEFPDRAKPSDDVKAYLEDFAKDKRWWVRLYAVSVINEAPDLVSTKTLARLGDDKHPRVRYAHNPPKEKSRPIRRPQQ